MSPLLVAETTHLKNQTIHACSGEEEWPPYAFFQRMNGKKTKEVKGYTIDVLTNILTHHQIKLIVNLIPWQRCLKWVALNKRYHIVLDASYNAQRDESYLLTRDYYQLTPYYFYANKSFPNGLEVKNPINLTKYGTLCGLHGYNYTNFGVNDSVVNKGARDYASLVVKTLSARCSFSLARYEIIVGFKLVGQDFFLDKKLRYARIPKTNPENFYMLISKNYQYAHELKSILDKGITQLERTGKLHSFLKKYIQTP
ncbi:substrate-binding periplasmic protein [Spartinivicinus ruber]|uniref:substrate-binding periplasmic protein n=1 Tax=Spartinivicinus ruber TaxID=2683272 RepID=UPI0013D5A236|nr:transporter substrate-binding domain-containing protein [Spartinivicinus ruber]